MNTTIKNGELVKNSTQLHRGTNEILCTSYDDVLKVFMKMETEELQIIDVFGPPPPQKKKW